MVKSTHPIQVDLANKGGYRVDRIREQHKRLGWEVDYRPVNANGVDLVCYKKQSPKDPNAICIDGNIYPKEIVKVYEITNWSIKGWMSVKRAKGIVNNLNEEAIYQRSIHPRAYILKILVVSYNQNIERIRLDLWLNSEIYIEVVGYDEEAPVVDKPIDGWVK